MLSTLTLVCLLVPQAARAGWDPNAGDWSKNDPRDLRVMTWNVHDTLTTTEAKQEGLNAWTALVMIVASIKPDVLIVQEAADSGHGADSVPDLLTVIDLFFHGGVDPFIGGNPQVTAYVRKYAPAYDLTHVFASGISDGYNRDVIMSRYPFADLNGDGKSELNDTALILSDEYAPGGNGGIRGYQHAEIDLPDDVYAGNLVMGNSHLKAGSDSSDKSQRLDAAQNIAYYIDYLYNGAGTGYPDPHSKILDFPAATQILSPDTFFVTGGDWNEDEQKNGRKGPAEWIAWAALSDGQGGSDGTDRDRTDMTFDDARDLFTGDRATLSSSKLDYIAWQDSIGSQRVSFIFDSATIPSGSIPPELSGFPINPALASGLASDHLPVIVDFALTPSGCVRNAINASPGSNGGWGPVAHQVVCAGRHGAQIWLDGAPKHQPVLLGVARVVMRSPGTPAAPGGRLVLREPRFLGPFLTDAAGMVSLQAPAGDGAPVDLYLQWVSWRGKGHAVDLSNMLRMRWRP